MLSSILAFLSPLWTKIGSFFSKHVFACIVSLIALILGVWLYFNITSKQNEIQELKISNANLKAANDSLRITKDKDDSIEYNKLAFVAKQNSDLKKVNSDLYKQIKATKGTVVAAISSSSKIIDSGIIKTVIVKDTSKTGIVTTDEQLTFDSIYSPGNYHHLKVTVKGIPDSLNLKAVLNSDEIGFTLFTGIKKDKDGNYEIFARTDYPGATITSLNGAFIDKSIFQKPDKKRILTLGFSVGYLPLLYNWSTKQASIFGPNLGATMGVNVNLTELLRKK